MDTIWPAVTILCIYGICALCSAVLHGKPKTGTFNAVSGLISSAIGLWLLYCGGFFDELLRRLV